jgi:hypothetical protein
VQYCPPDRISLASVALSAQSIPTAVQKSRANEDLLIQYTKGEAEAFEDLLRYARQVLIAFLDTRRRDVPIQLAFPGLNEACALWKPVNRTLTSNWKSWRNRTILNAETYAKEFMELPENEDMIDINTCKEFKEVLSQLFQNHMLLKVFKFIAKCINISGCTELAITFLRCKSFLCDTLKRAYSYARCLRYARLGRSFSPSLQTTSD